MRAALAFEHVAGAIARGASRAPASVKSTHRRDARVFGRAAMSKSRKIRAHDSSQDETSTTARVVTYNVLSSHLADASYFTHCLPYDLLADVRRGRVEMKLEREIDRRAVIALQEVSMSWAGPLHTYFAQRGYHFILSLYGKPFNNYMGVGLAVPLDAYEVMASDISRLSDTVRFPYVATKERNFGVLNPLYNALVKTPLWAWRKLRDYQPPSDEWQTARSRFNSILYVTLTCKKTNVQFGVATYHMPCMFRTSADRRVMTIHAGIAAQYALNQSKGLPTVLMGDFNLKPGDAGHTLITTGNLDETNDAYPVLPEGYEGKPFVVRPPQKMESAYARFNGQEPNFTNNAQIKDDDPFIDTLDYIFVTDDIEVVDVLELPHRDDVKGPFPTETEPSDHIMLAATIRVK